MLLLRIIPHITKLVVVATPVCYYCKMKSIKIIQYTMS